MARTPYQDFEGSRGEFLKLLLEQGEEPSFLRRARAVEEAWGELLARCQTNRDDMLHWARMRLAELAQMVGNDWSRLTPHLADESHSTQFERLHEEWKSQLPGVVRSASFWSTVSSALNGFVNSVERFNAAWEKHLQSIDLSSINCLRADYNRYYPTEKSAAFDTEDVARLGFTPLAHATIEDLRIKFPLVILPALRR